MSNGFFTIQFLTLFIMRGRGFLIEVKLKDNTTLREGLTKSMRKLRGGMFLMSRTL